MDLSKPIFIVGMPGSGKTTLGRPLARLLQRQFIDLDTYIVNRYHASVSDIFKREGVEGFRRKEQAMLREVAEFYAIVVSCGGGTPCYEDNMDVMLDHGLTVWLQAGDERLLDRLSRRREHRPLIADSTDDEIRQYIHATRLEREPYYSRAHLQHCGESLECRDDIEAAAQALVQKIEEYAL